MNKKQLFKAISLLLILIMMLSFSACGEKPAKTDANGYADQTAFLKDMAKGIKDRAAAVDDEKHANDTDEQKAEYYKALVKCELDQIAKYEDAVFEDSKFDDLAHHYIRAVQMQKSGAENLKRASLYTALWNGGRTVRAGIIVYLYENYDLPITSEIASSFLSGSSVTYSVSGSSILNNDEGEVVLEKGDLTVQDASGETVQHSWDNKSDYKYQFVIKNDSEYDLSYIGVKCAILDKDENVLDSRWADVNVTVGAGKTAICKSQFVIEDYPTAKYVRVDSASYDGNNNHSAHEIAIDESEIARYTLTIK